MKYMIETWTTQEIKIFEPIQRMTMKSWMHVNRVMPTTSSKPGLWDAELTPFLDGLMDLITLPTTQEFYLKKSAQISGSELAYSFVMWANDQQPGDTLVVLADQDTSEYTCKDRFEKSYLASPKLKKLYISSTLNTLTTLGQKIYFAWATSINKLASKPIKYLVLDEISKYKVNKLETKAIYNAIERTETYNDKKIIALSTPNVENSEIDIMFKTAHVRYYYYVPCPDCGHFQVLRWTEQEYYDLKGEKRISGKVYWQGGEKAEPNQIQNAAYQCGECKTLWTTEQKNKAVSQGVWHTNDQYKGTPSKIAAHINRLYSLFPGGKFQSLVEEFIRKKKDGTVDAWKGFINNVLAEEFVEVVDSAKKINIHQYVSKRESQIVPSNTIAVTCGVDNQKDFKYYTVLAFNKDFQCGVVEFGKLDNWIKLLELSNKRYKIEGTEKEVKIWKVAIDSGGTTVDGKNMTHDVYTFIRKNDVARFFAIKGKDMDNSIIVQKKKLEGNMDLYRVNTQSLLDQFFWMLGQGDFSFFKETSREFMQHILNFQKVRDSSGRFIWKKKGGRIDYVHTIIYALAAAHPQWDSGITELKRLPFSYNSDQSKKNKVVKQEKRTNRIINPRARR